MSHARASLWVLASVISVLAASVTPAYGWHGNGNVTSVAVDPLTPATVYAGTADRGVFKSTNGGANWSPTGLTNTPVYALAGLLFAVVAVMSALDGANPKRWMNAGFWGLFAASFLFGDRLGDFGNGLLVIAMVAIAGTVGLGVGRPATTTAEQRKLLARKFGNCIFVPALAIPIVTV